jgi:hypothetical protein
MALREGQGEKRWVSLCGHLTQLQRDEPRRADGVGVPALTFVGSVNADMDPDRL